MPDMYWGDDVAKAIEESLPTGPKQRNLLVFDFARALKAVAPLADAKAVHLKPYVRLWHERARPFITTQEFEETWIDFLRGWPRVKYAKGVWPWRTSSR